MIPFRLSFEPGISLYEQVVYAAKKAVISGPDAARRCLSFGPRAQQSAEDQSQYGPQGGYPTG